MICEFWLNQLWNLLKVFNSLRMANGYSGWVNCSFDRTSQKIFIHSPKVFKTLKNCSSGRIKGSFDITRYFKKPEKNYESFLPKNFHQLFDNTFFSLIWFLRNKNNKTTSLTMIPASQKEHKILIFLEIETFISPTLHGSFLSSASQWTTS